jgi:hypothetical protein
MTELTIFMLPHRFEAFSKTLDGDEHGFGERILRLEMVSGQRNLDIKLPVVCRYEDNMLTFFAMIHKNYWLLLGNSVVVDGHVKVIFDDGEHDYLAKLAIPGAKPPREGSVDMIFY